MKKIILLITTLLLILSNTFTSTVAFAEVASNQTNISNNKWLTLKGDPIAVQKMSVKKSMANKKLEKVIYLAEGTQIKLEGPFADLGGYLVESKKFNNKNKNIIYVLNDEGLSEDNNENLVHKNPTQFISKDEPTFNKASLKWDDKLTTKQKQAINFYTRNYADINNYLRKISKNASSKTKNQIKSIDKAFKKFKNPSKTTIYRGLDTKSFLKGIEGKKLKKNAVYTDLGYMSSTFDRAIAEKYSAGIVLSIQIPKNKNTGAYIGNISDWKIEKEYLIKHNSTFKITSWDKQGSNTLVNLKFIK
ncbi:MAG: ADP-ribosyltransferase [Lactobacillaceae bacterium]|jgi:hypothetical protein|nr:ADP-ribosyltransferase [Lactobacillaceae bacterium]